MSSYSEKGIHGTKNPGGAEMYTAFMGAASRDQTAHDSASTWALAYKRIIAEDDA